MQRQRKVRREPFMATDDHSGKEYRLCVVETQIEVTDLGDGKRHWKTMAREIEVAGGTANYKGPGHYELLTTRGTITLHSADENAI
jgi:hypothetical protein